MMCDTAKQLLERVASWPEEDQKELAELAREIEARRSGVYEPTPKRDARVKPAHDDGESGSIRRRPR